ncbi:hypothetical protein QBC34DRAFT_429152 [Podospora aff. communis PSN243]|uniref:Ecp2 effector protein domain-containing protein n=1 Tax=Podospora aff. communis PSN243 TaxID=3040156 RepID=A0AAV9GBW8_9PEZI|nr:hypothetical protein QBC34DRAFT_429152 [Podospora aff. communis PSN243]
MPTSITCRLVHHVFALSFALLAANAAVMQPLGLHELSARGECKRDLETVTTFTEKLFTGNAKLTYAISGTGAAYSTCRIVNHYAGTEHPCTDFTVLMAVLAYSADYFMLDEWIGVVGIDYILLKVLSLGLRIIPEVRGIGEEYEDVNVCGSLQQIAHDELKL